jgi:hypothetical protein
MQPLLRAGALRPPADSKMQKDHATAPVAISPLIHALAVLAFGRGDKDRLEQFAPTLLGTDLARDHMHLSVRLLLHTPGASAPISWAAAVYRAMVALSVPSREVFLGKKQAARRNGEWRDVAPVSRMSIQHRESRRATHPQRHDSAQGSVQPKVPISRPSKGPLCSSRRALGLAARCI